VLRHAKFQHCQLTNASFANADLRWMSLAECDTAGADFTGAIGAPAALAVRPQG
jgi:uncharacterized protein YjbI with pentapeptide repeats